MRYTKLSEIRKHSFLIVPKELFVNKRYKNLSNDAIIAYSLLLDRLSLSEKNKWHDENDNVFLIYTREQLSERLNVSLKTVTNIMRQLAEVELIEEKRQGLNKPNLIYIGQLEYEYKAGDMPTLEEDNEKQEGLRLLRDYKALMEDDLM